MISEMTVAVEHDYGLSQQIMKHECDTADYVEDVVLNNHWFQFILVHCQNQLAEDMQVAYHY